MKKWQEERNYRRVRNEGGEVIANIITVDGMDVEVPEDVYLAYAQADRRERYITEEQSSGKLLSLEQMEEDALLPDYVGAETAPSAETEALEREDLRNLAEQKQILLLALRSHVGCEGAAVGGISPIPTADAGPQRTPHHRTVPAHAGSGVAGHRRGMGGL